MLNIKTIFNLLWKWNYFTCIFTGIGNDVSNDDTDDISYNNSITTVTRDDAFDPDQWELVDEDMCVLDLDGMMDRNYLKTCDKDKIKLIGLMDSEKPVIQVEEYIFKGIY